MFWMNSAQLLTLVPMFALLIWAACQDVYERRIPNWLTFSLLVMGIAQSFLPNGIVSWKQSMLGFAVGFGLLFFLFALRAVGGGDVKLLAALGAWFGWAGILSIFVLEKMLGLVIVVIQASWQGRLREVLRNSALLAINVRHVRELGVDHVSETGQSAQAIKTRLPYAVPVLIAVVIWVVILSFAAKR